MDAAVIGSRDRWARRLTGLARELELRELELDDEQGARAAALAREREELEHLKRFSLPLIDELSELPARAPWSEWLTALERLASRALAHPENVLAVLKELRPMGSVGPVDWGEVRDVLGERLTLLPQRASDGRYGCVWVAPIELARGMSVELVVIPGVAERMFPRKIAEDPLLLDEARKELDGGLPVQADRIREERLCAAARRRRRERPRRLQLSIGRSRQGPGKRCRRSTCWRSRARAVESSPTSRRSSATRRPRAARASAGRPRGGSTRRSTRASSTSRSSRRP